MPFPPGGGTDIGTRIIAQKLSARFNQQVVVDNRGGAAGIIGTELAAKAAPDGYTLMMGNIGTHAINVSLYSKLPYDPVKDFIPVTQAAGLPLFVLVHPSLPVKSVKELIAFAKAGKLRPLAVTSAKRSVAHPELPTVSEAGLPGYESISWLGVFVPAGTPRDIVTLLNTEIVRILNMADVKERLLSQGAEPIGNTQEQFVAVLKSDIAKYSKLMREAGVKVE